MKLTYTLNSGRDVSRSYFVCMERGSELHEAVNTAANTDAVRLYTLLGSTEMDPEEIYGGYISFFPQTSAEGGYQESLTKPQAQKLYRALLRDAELGHGQRDMMDDTHVCALEMDFNVPDRDIYLNRITPDCTETIAVLLELGVTNQAENLFYQE